MDNTNRYIPTQAEVRKPYEVAYERLDFWGFPRWNFFVEFKPTKDKLELTLFAPSLSNGKTVRVDSEFPIDGNTKTFDIIDDIDFGIEVEAMISEALEFESEHRNDL